MKSYDLPADLIASSDSMARALSVSSRGLPNSLARAETATMACHWLERTILQAIEKGTSDATIKQFKGNVRKAISDERARIGRVLKETQSQDWANVTRFPWLAPTLTLNVVKGTHEYEAKLTDSYLPFLETVADPVADPVAETVADPVAETVAETVADPVAETVADPVAETVADNMPEMVRLRLENEMLKSIVLEMIEADEITNAALIERALALVA